MGFFGDFLSKKMKKAVSDVVGTAVEGVYHANGFAGENSHDADDACRGEADLRKRIETIVATEWPDYELRRNVPSSEFGASEGARKEYSYGIYRNGIVVAMIMLLDGNNEYRLKEVRLAQQACKDQRIPYMNFMTYMANHRSYISKRFKDEIIG